MHIIFWVKIYSLVWTYITCNNSSALLVRNGFIPSAQFHSVYPVRIRFAPNVFHPHKKNQKHPSIVLITVINNLLLMWKLTCIFSKLFRGYLKILQELRLKVISMKGGVGCKNSSNQNRMIWRHSLNYLSRFITIKLIAL
jgi:hypothetical protein